MVHPQCRGYVHKLFFIQLATKNHSLIYALSCRSLQALKSAHTAAGLCAHSCRSFFLFLQKPSAHTAAEVVHAHSWDLTFPYIINLSFAFLFFTSKSLTFSYLQECLFIHRTITKPWLQNMGTQNPKPWI